MKTAVAILSALLVVSVACNFLLARKVVRQELELFTAKLMADAEKEIGEIGDKMVTDNLTEMLGGAMATNQLLLAYGTNRPGETNWFMWRMLAGQTNDAIYRGRKK